MLGFFYSPIAFVLGTAFLALNGFSFWALMQALSDPSQPAEVGAVLQGFYGGTLLHWVLVFSLLSLLSMRSVAEEKRSGLWEALVTTQMETWTLLLAKWFGLVFFYCLLWAPSIFLVVVFTTYLPPEQSLDWGPVWAAYFGVFSIGAALAAIGILVSCTTSNPLVAAFASLVVFFAWLMLGEFGGAESSSWLFLIPLRQSLGQFARGDIQLSSLVNLVSTTLIALSLSASIVTVNRQQKRRFLIASAALLLGALGASRLTTLHGKSLDWTRAKTNQLSASTLATLEALDQPVTITLVSPTDQVFESVHREVRRLIGRMAAAQPLLQRREVDPVAQSQDIAKWAFELGARGEDLASGGAVIFEQAGRRRVVDFMAMASYTFDTLGVGSLAEFRAESAFRQAIAQVSAHRQERLCVSSGHGEMPMQAQEGLLARQQWQRGAKRMVQEGVRLQGVPGLRAQTLEGCDALLMMGPSQAFSLEELQSLELFLDDGGGVMIALRSRPALGSSSLPKTGLGLLLAKRGMQVQAAVVVDPPASLEVPPEWMTFEGYGDHPIVRDFQKRRATIWNAPLALSSSQEDVHTLVQGSAAAWGERSLDAFFDTGTYSKDPQDSAERRVALVSGGQGKGRLLLFGSADSLSSHWGQLGVGGNERLLVSSLLWVVGRDLQLQLESKPLEHLHLIMSQSQLRNAFLWLVIFGPCGFFLLGGVAWWWRRREI